MSNYQVIWTIDVEAESPQEAAEKAREIQLHPDSIATVFVVVRGDMTSSEIDLSDSVV